jgi:hypothetical protein
MIGVAWQSMTWIEAGVRDSVAGRSRGRVTLCAVCTVHVWRREARVSRFCLKTGSYSLLVVWPQNHWDRFLSLASKPAATVSCGLASKPLARFPGLDLKTGGCGLVI